MATAGEGATSYGGGGGKFRKKPLRRSQKTPYDRPPTALRNPTSNGWLSKLVDPASKLISASAHMFFSSVFRKRLPPLLPQPPPLPEVNEEPADELQEVPPNSSTEAKDLDSDQGRNLTDSPNGNGISELEQILTQKSFTRSEIERLTELLHSRTVELPVRDEGKLTEANRSNPPSNIQRHDVLSFSPMQESRDQRNKFISSPVGSSRVVEEDIASAAELAKAYMGSRPSKVSSPSMLGLRSQTLREGVPENGFMTPRSRGRSAIYSMARTPYSRGHPTTITQKGTRSTNYGFSGPSLTPRGWEHGGQSGTKQLALKRSSSTLDEDVGSVGPIRRIRQKSNLSTQDRRPTQDLLSLSGSKHKVAKSVEGNGDNSIASTSYAQQVPSKSSQVAAKILEHLERMTPKEKSSESKQLLNKSPAKLTSDMLSGQALRSLEDVDSSKLFKSPQLLSPDKVNLSTSLNQDKAELNAPKSSDISAASENVGGGVVDAKKSNSDVPNIALQPPQKKRAFQMSAREDAKEADDHMHSNGFGFKVPKEGEAGKQNKYAVAVTFGATSELLARAPAPVIEAEKTPAPAPAPAVDSATGFMFATSSTQAAHLIHSSSSSADKVVPPKDSNAASSNLFTSISKNADDKVPAFTFSSPSANERSSPTSGFQLDPKPETSKSVANVSFGASDGQPKILEADNKNTQDAGDLKGNTQTLPSSAAAAAATTSTTGMLSSSPGGENSNPNNGSFPSKFSIFSSTGPLGKKTMVGNSSSFPSIPSFMTSTSTSASAPLTTSAPAPAAAPLFSFGSSSTEAAPPPAASTTITTGVAEISDKQKVSGSSFPTTNFGFTAASQPSLFSSGGSLFSAPPPPISSSSASATVSKTSTTPFQFGSSPIFGSTSTSTTSSLFGSSSGSLFGSSAPSFGNTSSSSAAASASASTFGSSWQTNTFATSFNSSPSAAFSFVTSSSTTTTTTTTPTPDSNLFGGSSSAAAAASSAPMFSFTSAVATTSSSQLQQPIFGNYPASLFSSPATNGDQMNMEDSMEEDHPVQQSTPAVPVFGGPAASTASPGFMFGSAAPSTSVPFQFGGQNTSPFQASGSLDFNGGGSFKLGSRGGDKSGRRIVRASKTRNRKK